MSLNKYRDKEYMKEKQLGEMFKLGYEHDFVYDEEYKEYVAKETDLSDALRIVYLTMCYEDIISFSERKMVEREVAWQCPEEDVLRCDVIAPFFKLSRIKYLGITDVDGLVEYLNQFEVPEMIKENVNRIFFDLDDGFIVNHSFVYYSNESKELCSEERNIYSCLYKLDLSATPVHEGSRAKEHINNSYAWSPMVGKEHVRTLATDIASPYCHSKNCDWIYFTRKVTDIKYVLVAVNVMTEREIEYDGVPISFNDGVIIIQNKGTLYRLDGNDISEIYKLDKFEYADTHRSYFHCSRNELLISPVIRGAFVPYKIDYSGAYIGLDTTMSDYIRYSIISLEKLLIEGEDIDYHRFCYDGPEWYAYEDEYLKIECCTINSIIRFVEKISLSRIELAEHMKPLVNLLQLLGTVLDRDTDISDLLRSIRNHYIDSDKEYWESMIDIKYAPEDGVDEAVNRDILAKRFSDNTIIGYKYCSFISKDYVDMVAKTYASGGMQEYVGDVWFKDNCVGYEEMDRYWDNKVANIIKKMEEE